MQGDERHKTQDCRIDIRIIRTSYGSYRWEVVCFWGDDSGSAATYFDAAQAAGVAAEAFLSVEREDRWIVTDPAVKKGGGAT
jgi:hypothetical protein